jgi:acylphosphatase
MTDKVTKRVVVRGLVQGVGFRFATVREAEGHGITGWVRNRRDGTVEAVLQGPRDAVDRMLAWIETGPDGSRVDGIEVTDTDGEFTGFGSRPTA